MKVKEGVSASQELYSLYHWLFHTYMPGLPF